eukprot:GAHX01000589.1.p1 GENE.GAHX01000589.1~~GAHX01000589.1.p1  ORF type:complete len:357 (-),score=74.30 GAHX01000589.1:1199-2269(-)
MKKLKPGKGYRLHLLIALLLFLAVTITITTALLIFHQESISSSSSGDTATTHSTNVITVFDNEPNPTTSPNILYHNKRLTKQHKEDLYISLNLPTNDLQKLLETIQADLFSYIDSKDELLYNANRSDFDARFAFLHGFFIDLKLYTTINEAVENIKKLVDYTKFNNLQTRSFNTLLKHYIFDSFYTYDKNQCNFDHFVKSVFNEQHNSFTKNLKESAKITILFSKLDLYLLEKTEEKNEGGNVYVVKDIELLKFNQLRNCMNILRTVVTLDEYGKIVEVCILNENEIGKMVKENKIKDMEKYRKELYTKVDNILKYLCERKTVYDLDDLARLFGDVVDTLAAVNEIVKPPFEDTDE